MELARVQRNQTYWAGKNGWFLLGCFGIRGIYSLFSYLSDFVTVVSAIPGSECFLAGVAGTCASLPGQIFGRPPQVSAQFVLPVGRNVPIGGKVDPHEIPPGVDIDPLAEIAVFP
jgi:hypothetical protein